MPSYCHRQRGYLQWATWVPGLALAGFAAFAADQATAPRMILAASAVLMVLTGFCFQYLEVADAGEALSLRFGPIPLFHRRIPYARIRSVERTRSDVLDGWGIHYLGGRGWIWNVWGFDCVRLDLEGRHFRVGTDDAANLTAFLSTKIAAQPPRP